MKKALLYTLMPLGFMLTSCNDTVPTSLKKADNKDFWVASVKEQMPFDNRNTAEYLLNVMEHGIFKTVKTNVRSDFLSRRADRELRAVFLDPYNHRDTLAVASFSETDVRFSEKQIKETGNTAFKTANIHITSPFRHTDSIAVFDRTETIWDGKDPAKVKDVNILTIPKPR